MRNHIEEEQVTAYALGELEPGEAALVEAELEQNEELRRTVEEIRATAQLLQAELSKEPHFQLSAAQSESVQAQAAVAPVVELKVRKRLFSHRWVVDAVAACFLLALVSALVLPRLAGNSRKALLAQANHVAGRRYDRSLQADESANAPAPAPPPAHLREQSKKLIEPSAAALFKDAERVQADVYDTKEDVAASGSSAAKYSDFWRQGPPAKQEAEQLQSVGYLGGCTGARGGAGVQYNGTLPPGRPSYIPGYSAEGYDRIVENAFLDAKQNPLSTFSIDVDTASYANVRSYLNNGTQPPKDAVRIEELVNYFTYDYAPPRDGRPFAAYVEMADCPWRPQHRLVRIGLKGREIENEHRPPSNLVFLLDVSGSMQDPHKLPLLKQAMKLLVKQLNDRDRVAIVVYAGASGLALPSTSVSDQSAILRAIDQLEAGGSTNGGAGIELAYRLAADNFISGGVNRVILATDGDFNVGITNQGDLTRLIEDKAKSGVFLSVLGFGMGDFQDSNLEKLADKGNGNYAYIDTLQEARKALVEQMSGTLVTIAKDVKIQVEFNPAKVGAYRLIGYENRMLAKEDFNDDKKDAGEIGAGHVVTALYEIVLPGEESQLPAVDPLKYQQPARTAEESEDTLTLKLRYKAPDGDTSQLLEFPVKDAGEGLEQASSDFKFAAAVASFGMLLRDSEYKGNANYSSVLNLARENLGADPDGYRGDFVDLVRKARELQK